MLNTGINDISYMNGWSFCLQSASAKVTILTSIRSNGGLGLGLDVLYPNKITNSIKNGILCAVLVIACTEINSSYLVFDDTDVCFDSDFADASSNSLSVDRQTCSLLERARANDSLFFLSTTNQANLSSSPIMVDSRYENSFNFGGESIIDGTSKTDDDGNDNQEFSIQVKPCKQTVTKTGIILFGGFRFQFNGYWTRLGWSPKLH